MSESVALPRPSGWMVSPSWDLAFIVASPIVIVPAVWFLVRSTVTPEQLAIPVFAFATLGHHLPGYMRAYGDRELFARFKLRFVAVPPLLFGVVLLLVQPSYFGFGFAPPSSVQLLTVVWGAWHGLMQIYGFMRIYDAKQGLGHGLSQRLDLAVCFAIFFAGFLYSDSRMFALMNLVWQTGVPAFSREILETMRLVAGVGIGALTIAYLANLVRDRRQGRRMGSVKLGLAVSTGAIYTFSGLLTTNILVGSAVFEVFHAVQYIAIVWYFNRRLEDRVGGSFGPLRLFFRKSWASLVLYLAAVLLFGAAFLTMGTPRYGPIVGSGAATDTLYVLFSAFFVTSSLLHYYYDGFIWKLHDKDTGRNLGVTGPGLYEMNVPAVLHFGKWSVLGLVVALLVVLEVNRPASPERAEAHAIALAALTPDVPEARAVAIVRATDAGRTDEALGLAQTNLALRPRSHTSYADLARVQVARQDWPAAESAYRSALALLPNETVYYTDLARVIARQGEGRLDAAAAAFRQALSYDATDDALKLELAAVEERRGEPRAAVALLEEVLAKTPDDWATRTRLVAALLASGEKHQAVKVAEEGAALAPDAVGAQLSLGRTLMEAGRPAAAADAFEHARDLDPTLETIDYELGFARVVAGQFVRAEASLLQARANGNAPPNVYVLLARVYSKTDRQPLADVAKKLFVDSAPDPATGYRTLGSRFVAIQDFEAAEAAYQEALRLDPNHAPTRSRLEGLRARKR